MYTYLEFVDKKSAKFWEIYTRREHVFVHYGRQGSNGRILQKSFKTASAATHYAGTQVNAKIQKGYRRPAYHPSVSSYDVLSFTEANKKAGGALKVFEGRYDTVIFYPGNLTLSELDLKFSSALKDQLQLEYFIIVIMGDLNIENSIALYEHHPGLYVNGFTRAKTLEGGDCEIYLQDGEIEHYVYGSYNDGTLIAKSLDTQYVINSDHHMELESPNAIWINNYDNDDKYDYYPDDIADAFIEDILEFDDHQAQLNIQKLQQCLSAGKSPLKKTEH